MLYEFKCPEHGVFEVRQAITKEHKANCPKCGTPAIRQYSLLEWRWADAAFRKDGSRREDKDYAPVMRG